MISSGACSGVSTATAARGWGKTTCTQRKPRRPYSTCSHRRRPAEVNSKHQKLFLSAPVPFARPACGSCVPNHHSRLSHLLKGHVLEAERSKGGLDRCRSSQCLRRGGFTGSAWVKMEKLKSTDGKCEVFTVWKAQRSREVQERD